MDHRAILKELQTIPGIGPSIAEDLYDLGIRSISDLCGKDPEMMYLVSNKIAGTKQDRCLLYTFRCAVYFAGTPNSDPEKLKWWNWKDEE